MIARLQEEVQWGVFVGWAPKRLLESAASQDFDGDLPWMKESNFYKEATNLLEASKIWKIDVQLTGRSNLLLWR